MPLSTSLLCPLLVSPQLHLTRAAYLRIIALTDVNDVFTISFFETPTGGLDGVQLTHQNLTAGVAATRALLPTSSALSPLDTIVSAYPLSSPYGRAVAYTALFEGTGFATLDSTKLIKSDDGLCSITFTVCGLS